MLSILSIRFPKIKQLSSLTVPAWNLSSLSMNTGCRLRIGQSYGQLQMHSDLECVPIRIPLYRGLSGYHAVHAYKDGLESKND